MGIFPYHPSFLSSRVGNGENPVPHQNLKDKSCPQNNRSRKRTRSVRASYYIGPNSVTLTRVTPNDCHGASGDKDAAALHVPFFKDGQKRPHPVEILSTQTCTLVSLIPTKACCRTEPRPEVRSAPHAPSKTVCPTRLISPEMIDKDVSRESVCAGLQKNGLSRGVQRILRTIVGHHRISRLTRLAIENDT